MDASPFHIVCEIEPPTRPDLRHGVHLIPVGRYREISLRLEKASPSTVD